MLQHNYRDFVFDLQYISLDNNSLEKPWCDKAARFVFESLKENINSDVTNQVLVY